MALSQSVILSNFIDEASHSKWQSAKTCAVCDCQLTNTSRPLHKKFGQNVQKKFHW